MRIVFATKVARAPVLKALQALPGVDLETCDDLSAVAPLALDADALVISDPRGADGKAIAAALRDPECRVRWVQILTAGIEGLMAHGVPEHVVVTNQGGAVAPAVAEHGMMMLLAMARRTGDIIARSSRHEWSKDFSPPVMSLEGKVLAIVGFGNIGLQLARRAAGFDMEIIGVSRSLTSSPLAAEMHPMSALHQVLGRADAVALCVASSPATRHLMNQAAFKAIRKGALFINLTRGETVDQAALRNALVSGQLGGAFIDVTEPEPLPADDPLWDTPNLLISPHTAGAGSNRTGLRIAQVVSDNFARFSAGEALLHRAKK